MPQNYNPSLSGNPQSATSQQYPNGNPEAAYNPPWGEENTDSCVPCFIAPRRSSTTTVVTGPRRGISPSAGSMARTSPLLNRDPRIQVVQYNEDTFILRQNVCVHWEAPFTYLLFGNRGALLIDTGATAEANYYPLRATVDAIITRWSQMRLKKKVPLTVAFTSAEDIAQNQGQAQFAGRPGTMLAPAALADIKQFYKLDASWPAGVARIDLGGRVIDVIPTPDAHKDGLTFYDPYNDFLHTGDLIFPGKINISNDKDYVASLQRLKQWKDTHPVKWIMGGHIEMQFVPGLSPLRDLQALRAPAANGAAPA